MPAPIATYVTTGHIGQVLELIDVRKYQHIPQIFLKVHAVQLINPPKALKGSFALSSSLVVSIKEDYSHLGQIRNDPDCLALCCVESDCTVNTVNSAYYRVNHVTPIFSWHLKFYDDDATIDGLKVRVHYSLYNEDA